MGLSQQLRLALHSNNYISILGPFGDQWPGTCNEVPPYVVYEVNLTARLGLLPPRPLIIYSLPSVLPASRSSGYG